MPIKERFLPIYFPKLGNCMIANQIALFQHSIATYASLKIVYDIGSMLSFGPTTIIVFLFSKGQT